MTLARNLSHLFFAAVPLLAAAPAYAGDPTTADCLASSENSVSLRNQHALRAARAELLVCAASTCPADIRTECARRVEAVNASIPTLVFEVKDAAGNDVSAVKVTMDGRPLLERLEGSAVSLDPGEHKFTFESPGQPVVEKTLLIHEGEKDRRERVELVAKAAPTVETTPVNDAPGNTGNGQRVLGLVAGGVGVVGVGLGVLFFSSASSDWSKAQADCVSTASCANRAQAQQEHDNAASSMTISTIAFIAGGALIVTGAVLYLTAPSKNKSEKGTAMMLVPSASTNASGLLLRGTF